MNLFTSILSLSNIFIWFFNLYSFRFINLGKENTTSYGSIIIKTGKFGNYKTMKLWAKTYNMKIQRDFPPFIDNEFNFLGKEGSCFLFRKVMIILQPVLYIDTLSFKNTKNFPSIKTCQLTFYGKEKKTIKFGLGLESKSPIIINITPELMKNGNIYFCMKSTPEDSPFFGIWDIILFVKF